MKLLQTLKLLFDLRKGWGSWTIIATRLLAYVGAVDATFFAGDLGHGIVVGFMKLVSLTQIYMIDEAQATSFLVVVIGGLFTWLRAHTTEPVDGK